MRAAVRIQLDFGFLSVLLDFKILCSSAREYRKIPTGQFTTVLQCVFIHHYPTITTITYLPNIASIQKHNYFSFIKILCKD